MNPPATGKRMASVVMAASDVCNRRDMLLFDGRAMDVTTQTPIDEGEY